VNVENTLPLALYGAVLIFVILVFPGGIHGVFSRLRAALRSSRSGRSEGVS